MTLIQKIQDLPILQLIKSEFWDLFLAKDDKLVTLGQKILPLETIRYFQNMFPDCSKYHLQILETCYTSVDMLAKFYDFLELGQIAPATYVKDKAKFVKVFYGALFSFGGSGNGGNGGSGGGDLCFTLTSTILNSFEIKLPSIHSNRLHVKYLFSRLGLPGPIKLKEKRHFQLMLAPKAVSFLETHEFKIGTFKEQLSSSSCKSRAFGLAREHLESIGFSLFWVECYLFSVYIRNQFPQTELDMIIKSLSSSKIEYVKFVPIRKSGNLTCQVVAGYQDEESIIGVQSLENDPTKTLSSQISEFKCWYLRSLCCK